MIMSDQGNREKTGISLAPSSWKREVCTGALWTLVRGLEKFIKIQLIDIMSLKANDSYKKTKFVRETLHGAGVGFMMNGWQYLDGLSGKKANYL